MIAADTVLKRALDVRYREVGDEMVVVRQQAAEVLGLNEVGARLFDLLDAVTPLGGLLDRLQGEYEVDRAALEADAVAFLDRLLETGVVVEVEAPR